jgi:hypothetical protein
MEQGGSPSKGDKKNISRKIPKVKQQLILKVRKGTTHEEVEEIFHRASSKHYQVEHCRISGLRPLKSAGAASSAKFSFQNLDSFDSCPDFLQKSDDDLVDILQRSKSEDNSSTPIAGKVKQIDFDLSTDTQSTLDNIFGESDLNFVTVINENIDDLIENLDQTTKTQISPNKLSSSLTSIDKTTDMADSQSDKTIDLSNASFPPLRDVDQTKLEKFLGTSIKNTDKINVVSEVPKSKFRMHPGDFTGAIDEDLTEWITQYDRACRVNQWITDEEKGRYMPCFFTNAAALWFGNLEATAAEAELKSYKHLIKELKTAFDGKRVDDAVEFKLRNRKQGENEDVASYFNSVVNLCRRSNANMSDEAVVRHLVFGLKPELMKDVMLMANDTPKIFMKMQ